MNREKLNKFLKINLTLLLSFIVYFIINRLTGFYIPCLFRLITGLKCPGCGITHSLFALINLDFKEAFNQNPLVFIYLPFIFLYYIYISYIYLTNKKDNILTKIPNYIMIFIVVITLVYGVVRNFV